jgi:peptidoglycan/xylan/chitin deacetylase (PgdA/CDA1 family)
MYHRIASLSSDPWQIGVTPENFEEHLKILKQKYQVYSVPDLIKQLRDGKIEGNGVCITFDDAYADNYINAKPLLERYELPATFFVASEYIGKNRQFWWDELENMILHSASLPLKLSIAFSKELFEFELDKESLSDDDKFKQSVWMWEEIPPTRRCELFLELWKRLRPLSSIEIENILVELRTWAMHLQTFGQEEVAMSGSQLKEMYSNPLFTFGIHTLTHPALASHSHAIQEQEISDCKKALEQMSGLNINTLAYPYGNYNDVTLKVATEQKLSAAFTTQAKAVLASSSPLELGRLQVINQDAKSFEKFISDWL